MPGLFLIFRILTYLLDRPVALGLGWCLTIAAIVAVVIFCRALVLGIWGKPIHLTHAAERLDLSQSTHNRIATAMALLRSGDDSPFAKAAIADGFEYLGKLQREAPQVDDSTTSWRRKSVYLGISLALLTAGLFIEAGSRSSPGDGLALSATTPTADTGTEREVVLPDEKPLPVAIPAKRGERETILRVKPTDEESGENESEKRADSGKESHSQGPTGEDAAGKSRTSQSSSSSSSAASGAGVKSEPGASEPTPPKKQPEGKKPIASEPIAKAEKKKGGSINSRGSSAAGSMRTAQSEWNSEVKAKSNDNEDPQKNEEPDEKIDEEKQRLGAQPSLKNRTSNVSRELSLAMGKPSDKQSMKKGRSGPGAQKKSRGTATMIMGVPVPGFVKGRLLPGPTKSNQEEVEPTPRESDYVTASDLTIAEPEEAPQEHFRPSAAMSEQARNYLIQQHKENDNPPSGTPTND